MVSSIVLAAVATLSYALGTVNDNADETAVKQAQLRYTSLRISELIKNCKLITAVTADDLVVWRADDNGNEQINISELVYIETGTGRNFIQLTEFLPYVGQDSILQMTELGNSSTKILFSQQHYKKTTLLITQCSNVICSLNPQPPWTKSVIFSFDLEENGIIHTYQINASLRSWAGNLLDETGNFIVNDDD